jgi:hypothetical protein
MKLAQPSSVLKCVVLQSSQGFGPWKLFMIGFSRSLGAPTIGIQLNHQIRVLQLGAPLITIGFPLNNYNHLMINWDRPVQKPPKCWSSYTLIIILISSYIQTHIILYSYSMLLPYYFQKPYFKYFQVNLSPCPMLFPSRHQISPGYRVCSWFLHPTAALLPRRSFGTPHAPPSPPGHCRDGNGAWWPAQGRAVRCGAPELVTKWLMYDV